MKKYNLDERIDTLFDRVIVFNTEQHIAEDIFLEYKCNLELGIDEEHQHPPTFKELIEQAGVDLEERSVTYFLCESYLCGELYSFGNYDEEYVWKIGKTEGFA